MKLFAIEALVFVDLTDDQDPEEVASAFDSGFEESIRSFPDADVAGADVAGIRPATPEEVERYSE